MNDMADKWIKVGPVAQFDNGTHKILVGRRFVVMTKLKGRLFAFDAFCPHVQGPMDRAEIEGAIVSCPLHAWRFDLENEGKELHGYRGIAVHDVRINDGDVFLALSS
jgi:nitrite reductase/ring-hydroxylating ferredoxin subunit